jgi:hypothetical protein
MGRYSAGIIRGTMSEVATGRCLHLRPMGRACMTATPVSVVTTIYVPTGTSRALSTAGPREPCSGWFNRFGVGYRWVRFWVDPTELLVHEAGKRKCLQKTSLWKSFIQYSLCSPLSMRASTWHIRRHAADAASSGALWGL